MQIQELIIYRNDKVTGKAGSEKTGLLPQMLWLANNYQDGSKRGEALPRLARCLNHLFSWAEETGFQGNLWHCYLADWLANHENCFSLACENNRMPDTTISTAVLDDLATIRGWFTLDLDDMARELDSAVLPLILDYQVAQSAGKIYGETIRDRIGRLAGELAGAINEREMRDALATFYQQLGVGKFGLHQTFRVESRETSARIVPIYRPTVVSLTDLVGYELPKKKLTDNTEAFLQGKGANNCLLYGDAGTGKSSSIKGLANEYYEAGLRIIEIYKHQCGLLNEVVDQIKHRNYKFILYMDDLSFEDFEVEYKYLKAVIEGGLEKKPDNLLIYATSNRRHLIRERFSDKADGGDDLHKSDTVQEKLSLSARFGETIYFGAPGRKEYHRIVSELAQRQGYIRPEAGQGEALSLLADQERAEMPVVRWTEAELLAAADRWELAHGGLSGRTAQQFIDYLG
ncbi:MAG: ATP-binding protein [Lachnospiraceae bacterium]|jgi:predicted AAA+ superfamily ATPase|nr:ATP-binding protein [Lachnospiraceae bacterium]